MEYKGKGGGKKQGNHKMFYKKPHCVRFSSLIMTIRAEHFLIQF